MKEDSCPAEQGQHEGVLCFSSPVQEQPNELGIDPWARSAGAAKESVYRQVNHLLRPDERNEILQLCGRALNHPITTAVALRVRPAQLHA